MLHHGAWRAWVLSQLWGVLIFSLALMASGGLSSEMTCPMRTRMLVSRSTNWVNSHPFSIAHSFAHSFEISHDED